MKEIYWIQRLDGLCAFCEALVILSIITAIVAAIAIFVFWLNAYDESDEIIISSGKRVFIISCITAVLFGSAVVFVPTSEEALIIYGVGGTVDYVQDNEKLQQLPDKVVEALTMWVDTLTEEDKR